MNQRDPDTKPRITLETKVWERDWEYIMNGPRLRQMIERCHFPFDRRVLMINNFMDYAPVKQRAAELIQNGIIDAFYVVEDFAAKALEFFNIETESFGVGYVYSVAELVSIYLCETEYLLHFSGDSIPEKGIASGWLDECIDLLVNELDIKVVNLTWNHKIKEVKKESTGRRGNFFVGYGFSDQMYLIRTADFRAPIYGETHAAGTRYPDYGGNLFERRVDAWMRNHHAMRATYANGSYVHVNFPRTQLEKLLWPIRSFSL